MCHLLPSGFGSWLSSDTVTKLNLGSTGMCGLRESKLQSALLRVCDCASSEAVLCIPLRKAGWLRGLKGA